MAMKSLLMAAALAASPAFAHGGEHGKAAAAHKDAPKSFDKRPPNGTWARCAVSGDVFQVSDATEFSTYQGRTWAFCCPDCKPDFDKHPDRYVK